MMQGVKNDFELNTLKWFQTLNYLKEKSSATCNFSACLFDNIFLSCLNRIQIC